MTTILYIQCASPYPALLLPAIIYIAVPRVALRVLGGDTHSVRLVVYTILYTPYSV